jgi:hypothetical protein
LFLTTTIIIIINTTAITPIIIKIIHHGKVLPSLPGSFEFEFDMHEVLSDEVVTT